MVRHAVSTRAMSVAPHATLLLEGEATERDTLVYSVLFYPRIHYLRWHRSQSYRTYPLLAGSKGLDQARHNQLINESR